MIVAELSRRELRARLQRGDLRLQTGCFTFAIQSRLPALLDGLALLYGNNVLAADSDFIDFHVQVDKPKTFRRWINPQVMFWLDGHAPFMPLPANQAVPFLEWGMNWCIAVNCNEFLILHAAVLERNGLAMIMPGPPGSGKSTLCAALVHNGWRLLSDELALLTLTDGKLVPLVRPISLKNESIDIIHRRHPMTPMSENCYDTIKGTVALMPAPSENLARVSELAIPGWIIFPKYEAGISLQARRRSKAGALLYVGQNAFNYSVLGTTGFELLANTVEACHCLDFSYSDLDEAITYFAALADGEAIGK